VTDREAAAKSRSCLAILVMLILLLLLICVVVAIRISAPDPAPPADTPRGAQLGITVPSQAMASAQVASSCLPGVATGGHRGLLMAPAPRRSAASRPVALVGLKRPPGPLFRITGSRSA
jgi:hypothetical protein